MDQVLDNNFSPEDLPGVDKASDLDREAEEQDEQDDMLDNSRGTLDSEETDAGTDDISGEDPENM